VAAEEFVLKPLDALVAGTHGYAERERDDEDAADSRDSSLADRGSRVANDAASRTSAM
jgi:hypothetical protein